MTDDLRTRIQGFTEKLAEMAPHYERQSDQAFAELVVAELTDLLDGTEHQGQQPLVARYRVADDNTVSKVAQHEIARITLTRTLLDDGEDLLDMERTGDAQTFIVALGMLASAMHDVNHPETQDSDDEDDDL